MCIDTSRIFKKKAFQSKANRPLSNRPGLGGPQMNKFEQDLSYGEPYPVERRTKQGYQWLHCRNSKELYWSWMHWHVPIIGDLSESHASGLADNCEMKSMLSLLEGDPGNARMAGCPDVAWWLMSHLAAEALWAVVHINEIGYHIPTPTTRTYFKKKHTCLYSCQETTETDKGSSTTSDTVNKPKCPVLIHLKEMVESIHSY